MRPRHLFLGLSVVAALLSFGCPQQNNDPMQAFNDPKTTNGLPNNPDQGPAPVPEPASALLFGVALLIGGGILRRRYSNHQSSSHR
jgi:hypothetical protein